MARLSLNKAQLAREKQSLGVYGRFLPALDLKRKKLMAERAAAETRLRELDAEIARRIEEVGAEIPMLADTTIGLDGLVTIREVKISQANVVGQSVPVLESVEIDIAPYGYLARPHWVDPVADRLRKVIRMRIERRLLEREMALLDHAIVKVTRRVNLFEKVLIPQARENIRRIQIALGDRERAAVVTSKIAKRKREVAA